MAPMYVHWEKISLSLCIILDTQRTLSFSYFLFIEISFSDLCKRDHFFSIFPLFLSVQLNKTSLLHIENLKDIEDDTKAKRIL